VIQRCQNQQFLESFGLYFGTIFAAIDPIWCSIVCGCVCACDDDLCVCVCRCVCVRACVFSLSVIFVSRLF
jgi:hypothetical protein